MIDHLFNRLQALYASRWKGQFKSAEELENWKTVWADELTSRNISTEKVSRSLKNCPEMYDWPPSFPEFLKACKTKSADEPAVPEPENQLGYEFKPIPKEQAEKFIDDARSKLRPEHEYTGERRIFNEPAVREFLKRTSLDLRWAIHILGSPKRRNGTSIAKATECLQEHAPQLFVVFEKYKDVAPDRAVA